MDKSMTIQDLIRKYSFMILHVVCGTGIMSLWQVPFSVWAMKEMKLDSLQGARDYSHIHNVQSDFACWGWTLSKV
jgi:hypothetical protein